MPGISGAIRMPVGMPTRLSSATASSRARGCGVCGSVERHLRVERRDRQVRVDVGDLRDLLEEVEVAQQQR